jgi:hypothetical protein
VLLAFGAAPVRIFKNKPFARFARKAGVGDDALRTAMEAVGRGLVDADLGGGVFKQRIARAGGGKSGGLRTIILLKTGERAFFVRGFAKNEQDNIRDDGLAALKLFAAKMLSYDDAALALAVAEGILTEVQGDDKTIQ